MDTTGWKKAQSDCMGLEGSSWARWSPRRGFQQDCMGLEGFS